MRRICILLVLLISISTVQAQKIKALHIGDMLPDMSFAKMVPASKAIHTADHQDKLLIIDLWATNCSSCIAAMPRLDSLQQRFGAQVKILPATAEEEPMVNAFWKKNRNTRSLGISTVVEDTVLQKHFPHKSVSHDVWVYKGKVIAITPVEYVNAVNIQKVLDGRPVDLPLKDDFSGHFDGASHSIKDTGLTKASPDAMVKYAMVSKYKSGIKPGAIVNDDRGGISRNNGDRSVRAYFINQPVYTAYLWALLNAKGTEWMEMVMAVAGGFPPNRVIWDVADQSKYKYGKESYDEWLSKNGICYESLTPDTGQTDQIVYRQIAKDLNDLLGLDVHLEKRKIKTLVLIRAGQSDLLKTKNTGIDLSFNAYKEGDFFRLRNAGIGAFITEFNQYQGNPYAIDATGYKDKVDMDLNIKSWTDLPAIEKELARYGLAFKEEMREIEVLVFAETGGGYRQSTK